MNEVWGECGIGQRHCGRGVKCYKQGLRHGFVHMLRSLDFLLWTMGSHGMVVNVESAFWGDPCGCRVEGGWSQPLKR